MSKFKMLLKGSALRTMESAVSIAFGFVTMKLLIHSLGADLYGIWVLTGMYAGAMYIFDFGFASAVTRHVTHAIAQRDHRKANQIINSSFVLYCLLSLGIIIATLLTAFLFNRDLHGIISSSDFRIVLILLGLSIALEFPVKAFAGVATAHYRFDLLSLYRIVFKIISSSVLIFMLFSGCKLKAIAILSLAASVITGYAFFWVARYVYKEMEISKKYVNRETIRELFSYSAWAFLIDINLMLKQRIDLFFIGAYISLAAVTTYYVSLRLLEYTVEMLTKMLNVTLPVLTSHEANHDEKQFRNDLILFSRINAYVAVLALTGFIIFGKSIIYYWMGPRFEYEIAYHVLIILLVGNFSALIANGFTTALYAKSKHRLVAFVGFAETLISAAFLAIGLGLYHLGSIYVAYSIAIPMVFFRLFLLPYWSMKLMMIPNKYETLTRSFRPLLLLVPTATICYFLFNGNPVLSMNLLMVTLLVGVVALVFAFVEMAEREKELINRLINMRKFIRGN